MEQLNAYLADTHFEHRHFRRFEWFSRELTGVKTILNVGCGQGRETLALMWSFGADEAVGIDIDDDPHSPFRIHKACAMANLIHDFSRKFEQAISMLQRGCGGKYCRALRAWFEGSVPPEIKRGEVPTFYKMDVSARSVRCTKDSGGFDLVYCRYVLDKIADDGEEKMRSAIENMRSATKPGTGRVVAVEPSEKTKDGVRVEYRFESWFEQLELAVLAVKPEECLGGTEYPDTRPSGFICAVN